MAFVPDASIAAAWLLPDEDAALADLALDRLAGEMACVPSLFWHELRNLLLSAERRGESTYTMPTRPGPALPASHPLSGRSGRPSHPGVGAQSSSHGLRRKLSGSCHPEGCPLASLDRRLNEAAAAEGVAPSSDLVSAGPVPALTGRIHLDRLLFGLWRFSGPASRLLSKGLARHLRTAPGRRHRLTPRNSMQSIGCYADRRQCSARNNIRRGHTSQLWFGSSRRRWRAQVDLGR